MRFLSLLLITLSFSSLPAMAATSAGERGLAAGIIVGNPAAVTAKWWLDPATAMDLGLAWSSSEYVLIYSDYLWHIPGFFKTRNPYFNEFIPYFGVGGIFVIAQKERSSGDGFIGKKSGDFGAGIRIPIGVEWMIKHAGVFLEVAPGLSLTPATSSFIQGGLGIRYYF